MKMCYIGNFKLLQEFWEQFLGLTYFQIFFSRLISLATICSWGMVRVEILPMGITLSIIGPTHAAVFLRLSYNTYINKKWTTTSYVFVHIISTVQ